MTYCRQIHFAVPGGSGRSGAVACGRKEVYLMTALAEDVTCQSCIDTRLMRSEPLWSERAKAMAARFP